jgi:hypothetical protein
MYCGISATMFDRLVADGRMPGPCRIDGRKVWDIRAIDVAFDGLPREDARQKSSWEDRLPVAPYPGSPKAWAGWGLIERQDCARWV